MASTITIDPNSTPHVEKRYPDFVCIGAQKCGTTWLWKAFSRCPAVSTPPGRKEVHFFDRLILKHGLDWYQEQFTNLPQETEVAGEKTPCYAHLKSRSVKLIHELMPDLRIIVLLRRPDERAWSQARMEISKYNKRPLSSWDIVKCIFHLGILRNRVRTNYLRILNTWLEVFPREQVFVGCLDDIYGSPDKFLGRILSFLGVKATGSRDPEKLLDKVWASPELEMPNSVRWYLLRTYRPMLQRVTDTHSEIPRTWLTPVKPDINESLFGKAAVWIIANIATLPYNAAWRIYDLCRDIRMHFRIRALRKQLNSDSLANHYLEPRRKQIVK